MSTLLDEVWQGKTPQCLASIADDEGNTGDELRANLLSGSVVIPRNPNHLALQPIAIGAGCRVKINANIGASPLSCRFEDELAKLRAAIECGADAVMDLSIAGDVRRFRTRVLAESSIPVGTVPLYEAMLGVSRPEELTITHFLSVMEAQAREGVDFMTIHAGFQQRHLPLLKSRVMGVVSRGGSILAQWMRQHNQENFLYEHFDDILAIASAYDVTLSLGDGLRPGCSADANDAAQFGELDTLGELVRRCRAARVQVMVEGPGHVPLDLIEENVRRQKSICDNAPFYVLGPLVIDYAAGYDHIAGAIGGALAAWHGADFLCYLTPAEHLRLPSLDDVREGVIASKIAAAAADLARKRPAAIRRNREMSQARRDFDWERQQQLAIDPMKFCRYLEKAEQAEEDRDIPCTMCGDWCAMKREA
ncbi:phosphomethylpyrimidine synthase [Candidatus Moduliflexus flocculans]|uniref:Phosphomethylpyrimidine synthase n=1 Tax=Candidatus Moduliflexus flocculans TaxID=1499966 RepID=A0A081BPC1_9BACT|nr:phosphomethylpyrimidine synthase [Candidatus Moduliflexus flocculans]